MSNLLRLSACLTILLSFNAFAVDTDGDGFSDADEAILGTDPNDPTSPLENKLTASDAASEDQFGYSVSIDGDTAVIGARLDNDNGSASGSAYVYVRSNGVWSEQAKLTASDGASGDEFGYRVSIDGDTAVIGALHDNNGSGSAGSAYVFVRDNGVWSEQAKLTASDGAENDRFGYSVAIDGDTAVIGAISDQDNGHNSGSAYVYVRSNGVWSEQAKLTASDGASSDDFGLSASIDGDTAVIGAYGDDDNGSNSGSAYVYVRSNGVWSEQAKLTASDGASSDEFGRSVSIDGDTALIGANADDDNGSNSGSAYVYVRSNGVWSEQQKLTASDGASGDYFGISVSIAGDTAVIGARLDDDNGSNSGSAYVFRYNEALTAVQLAAAEDAVVAAQDFLDDAQDAVDTASANVAFLQEAAMVAEINVVDAQNFLADAVAITLQAQADVQAAQLTAQDAATIVVDAQNILTAAEADLATAEALRDVAAVVIQNALDAYILSSEALLLDPANPVLIQAKTDAANLVGSTNLALSSAQDDVDAAELTIDYAIQTVSSAQAAKAAAIINLQDATTVVVYGQYDVISAEDELAITQDYLATAEADVANAQGAEAAATTVAQNAAAAVVVAQAVVAAGDSGWTQQAKLTASDGAATDYFGISVSIDGDTAVIGAYLDDDNDYNSGSAYIFPLTPPSPPHQDTSAVITGSLDGNTTQGGFTFGSLQATDVDGLTDGTYFTVSNTPLYGQAQINPSTGLWTYLAGAIYVGADPFTVTVTDDLGGTTEQVVSITITAPDSDGDGTYDFQDNCPSVFNADQANLDNDAFGDACDSDIDGDGTDNAFDAFPNDSTESADSDADNVGDNADNCVNDANADQANLDGDALGDACDPDMDGDGIANYTEIRFGGDETDNTDAAVSLANVETFSETAPADSDLDGVPDDVEAMLGEDNTSSTFQDLLDTLSTIATAKNVPAMGGIGLLALGLSMLGLGAVRLRRK